MSSPESSDNIPHPSAPVDSARDHHRRVRQFTKIYSLFRGNRFTLRKFLRSWIGLDIGRQGRGTLSCRRNAFRHILEEDDFRPFLPSRPAEQVAAVRSLVAAELDLLS